MAGLFLTVWVIGMMLLQAAALFAMVSVAARLAIRHEAGLGRSFGRNQEIS